MLIVAHKRRRQQPVAHGTTLAVAVAVDAAEVQDVLISGRRRILCHKIPDANPNPRLHLLTGVHDKRSERNRNTYQTFEEHSVTAARSVIWIRLPC